jgi:thiamine transport system permease protein
MVSLLGTAIVAPGIVIALGVISVWGRSGWISDFFDLFSINWTWSIFGLSGILLAHTVLNGAFAAHLLLARLGAIPTQKLKTAQSLALGAFRRFRVLDWPAISGALPGLASIIFLLTFTSFPIVLLLGGGPANQTLEVAIYTAVRQSFDLKTAVNLSLVQLAVCTAIILPALLSTPSLTSAGITSPPHWPDKIPVKIFQILILLTALFGFGMPLVAVIIKGISPGIIETLARTSFWQAALTSLTIGSVSAFLTVLIAIRIAMARIAFSKNLPQVLLSLPLFAYLVMPSLVISLGFFLGLRFFDIASGKAAPFVLITANVLLALPFAFATLSPALLSIDRRYNRLVTSLNLSGFTRWRKIEWPLMGREIGLAGALAFCFSLGDLGVISLFGTSDFTTLPWQMFRAMGAYRTNEAATIAAVMLILCLVMFWALPALMQKSAKQC